MLDLPAKDASYWIDSAPLEPYAPLAENLEVDTAVIGGGLGGLNIAYQLKKGGLRVAVIEKDRIGRGVTGSTTGKATAQHGKIYAGLQDRFGEKMARLYADANQAALNELRRIIKDEKIDCEWQDDDNYVYSEDRREIYSLQEEARVAQSLGLPASFETATGLPFEVAGAVKFTGQGKMHSVKYLNGLAKAIQGQGSFVFEKTKAKSFHDNRPCKVLTDGGTISAKSVVVSTHVPFPLMTHGAYCLLEYPTRSYVVAGPNSSGIKGMYISSDSPTRSILPVKTGGQDLILIGGDSHVPGFSWGGARHYRALADFAGNNLKLKKLDYKWNTMDYMGYDSRPLIGKLYPWSANIYVATAFMKWGLTNSVVAGLILRDLVQKQHNVWAETFDSTRLSPIAAIPHTAINYFK
jgi:glycine/D-amino acid oxidase-like deaminating enzyme